MAWPSTSARTKAWGTEILTAGDLNGQFDILHTYNNDQLNGTTGHKHSGGTNDGPLLPLTTAVSGILPVANGGTSYASYGVGDILYASAAAVLSKLSPSSAGQAVTSAGATTAPIYAGMTTQGDTEYHNGTTRTALAAGTSGQVKKTQGAGANPLWSNIFSSCLDYASSQSSSTARQGTTLKVCYGSAAPAGSSSVTVTNLPFTSGTSYMVVIGNYTAFNMAVSGKTATQFTLTNTHNDNVGGNGNGDWFAIGT